MSKVYKTPLEKKIIRSLNGINANTKSQLKKIQKVKPIKLLPQVPTSKLYIYMNGRWELKGTACRLCDNLINTEQLLEKHRYICKVLNRKEKEKD